MTFTFLLPHKNLQNLYIDSVKSLLKNVYFNLKGNFNLYDQTGSDDISETGSDHILNIGSELILISGSRFDQTPGSGTLTLTETGVYIMQNTMVLEEAG